MSFTPPEPPPAAPQPSAGFPPPAAPETAPLLAPPLPAPAKRASRGLVTGMVVIAVLVVVLMIAVAGGFISTLVRSLDEPDYAVDAPEGVQEASYPAGFEPSEEFEAGVASGPSDTLESASPAECTDLYFTAPESNVGSSEYSTYAIASASNGTDAYVDAYARVFDSAGAARSFLAHTSDMIDACGNGYWIPSEDGTYETSAVLPVTIPTEIDAVGWSEPAPDGTENDFTAADFRIGNLVVRASCTAEPDVCDAFWATVESQMLGIEAD